MEILSAELASQNGCLGSHAPSDGRNSQKHFLKHKPQLEGIEKKGTRLDCKSLFEKKFQYRKQKDEEAWQLPEPNKLFTDFYQVPQLQELKKRLNSVKSKLNDYLLEDWSAHTRRKDPSGEIPFQLKNETKAEFVTVAWCKFFECLHNYPLVNAPKLNSLHLCEAPGAFIAALNHYLYWRYEETEVQWQWLATTLNPYYEGNPVNRMISDDRLILYTLEHWLFHNDFTGNIISKENIENLKQQCSERFDGEVHLITADGSIDCVGTPECQEDVVAMLHFAEIATALSILTEGGCFIIKMFTLFEATSLSKMFLLNCVFDEVHVFKPATSRRGNSEVYVICLGYKKTTKYLTEILNVMKTNLDATKNLLPLFSKIHYPPSFLLQHEICARLFMNLQIEAIESNIYSYEFKTKRETRHCHSLRQMVCKAFFERYKVTALPTRLAIVPRRLHHTLHSNTIKIYRGSYTDRADFNVSTQAQQLFILRGRLNELEKMFDGSRGELFSEGTANGGPKPELKIYTGAPITNVHSSLFASVHILALRSQLQAVFHSEPMYQIPAYCRMEDIIELLMDNQANLNFSEIQHKFFTSILTAILNQQPNSMHFANVAFLTHYSVSFLRYLAIHVFQHITISTVGEDCKINLQRKQCAYDKNTLLKVKTLSDATVDKLNVLSVMDLSYLHNTDFTNALREYNNCLLLRNIASILNV